ncbi:hypothetical protein [Winogradskyella sp.]|uniref:hypothetical protein n=1 Tax=Winogradskyella sp. TaxID=1883156 RepID=UPI00262CA426|nr:hypothetical protein [Winogradskyella sp.]
MIYTIILIIIIVALIKFNSSKAKIISNPKVLILEFKNDRLESYGDYDYEQYLKLFSEVDYKIIETVEEVINLSSNSYNLIQMNFELNETGEIRDCNGNKIFLGDIIKSAYSHRTNYFLVGVSNSGLSYKSVIESLRINANIIMTMERNKTDYMSFISSLLNNSKETKSLAKSWQIVNNSLESNLEMISYISAKNIILGSRKD